MKQSKKASSKVTAAAWGATAAAAESQTAASHKATRSGAVENVAQRQFQKSGAKAIQSHMRARGQRQQAKRDAR